MVHGLRIKAINKMLLIAIVMVTVSLIVVAIEMLTTVSTAPKMVKNRTFNRMKKNKSESSVRYLDNVHNIVVLEAL